MDPGTIREAVALAKAVRAIDSHGVTVGAAPPAISLPSVAEVLRGSLVHTYAQDVHWEEKGAYTGQISASMLVGIARGAIVGHSEVRRDLGDTDERVARKMIAALRHGLHVVVCVGESEDEYAAGATNEIITAQARVLLRALEDADRTRDMSERLVIAYEPIWAIGTGRPAAGSHASGAARTIRATIESELGLSGDAIPILYGGSVSGSNVAEFARAEGVDGALVGGASLKAEEFAAIVAAFN